MKKTLVALAVLAAAGTSFAQVTISGKLGFSYQKNANPAGGSANHGMAMADGDLNFTATEDLGGGMKVTAKSAFASRGRDNTFAARDASLTVSGSAAVVTLGSVESCSAILNTAGAPVSLATGHDTAAVTGGTDAPIDGCANIDIAQVTVPMGAFSISAAYIDSIGRFITGGTAGPGGSGDLTANLVGASYSSGPLSVGVDYTVYAANAAIQGVAGTYWDGLSRTRLFGSYDLGVAKVGAGFQVNNHDKAAQSNVSVNVPLGAVSVGLVHSMRAAQGASTYTGLTVADARTGTAVGATYNLSKMTNINASYSVYSNNVARDNEFRVRLMQSF